MTGTLVRSEETPVYTVVPQMPQMTVQQAVERRKQLVAFVQQIMVKGTDYGIIPGTEKPTLLKPGAEKLTTFFGLRPRFEMLDKVEDWDKGRFYYRYSCELWHSGEMIATGEASANSMEKKYRWENVPSFYATDEDKKLAIRTEKRKSRKTGKDFEVYVLENRDPYTLVNTLQKMAQKRALIAATLVGVNASEFFTQDIEDMMPAAEVVDGEATEAATVHWIDEPDKRRQFFAHLSKRGLSDADAKKLLKLEHLHDWPGTAAEMLTAIDAATGKAA